MTTQSVTSQAGTRHGSGLVVTNEKKYSDAPHISPDNPNHLAGVADTLTLIGMMDEAAKVMEYARALERAAGLDVALAAGVDALRELLGIPANSPDTTIGIVNAWRDSDPNLFARYRLADVCATARLVSRGWVREYDNNIHGEVIA